MLKVLQRARNSLKKNGVWGSVRLIGPFCREVLHDLDPDCRRRRRWSRDRMGLREAARQEFDVPNGVDTAQIVDLESLTIESDSKLYGYRYEPILPVEFHEMMAVAGDVAARRVFVDLGCGKGRAVLLAAEYAFRRIVGVEFARELAELAQRNLKTYRNPRRKVSELEIVWGDAAQFQVPDDPIVLLVHNPFNEVVMKAVVENLLHSLERVPRPATVIYGNPLHDEVWSRTTLLTKAASVHDHDGQLGFSVYHYSGNTARSA